MIISSVHYLGKLSSEELAPGGTTEQGWSNCLPFSVVEESAGGLPPPASVGSGWRFQKSASLRNCQITVMLISKTRTRLLDSKEFTSLEFRKGDFPF